MSKMPRLPTLVNRFIEIEWLQKDTSQYVLDPDSAIPETYDQSQLIAPFRCRFTGLTVSDGFYSIPSRVMVSLPSNSNILVTNWRLIYQSNILIEILSAEILHGNPSQDSPTINIESNPSVYDTLRRYKFNQIQKELQEMETSSECSENPNLTIGSLHKLVNEDNKLPEIPENPETPHKDPKVSTGSISNTPINTHIGFGTNSSTKAQEFSTKRIHVEDTSQDVVKMTEPADVIKIIIEEKPRTSSTISINCDLGIERFPPHALEYLKHKYNIL
jgi:hypothetical protein